MSNISPRPGNSDEIQNALLASLESLASGTGQAIVKLNSTNLGLVSVVSSVFGRSGAVVAASGDYTTAQVTESGNLYFTNVRAISALTGQSNTIFTNGAGYITSASLPVGANPSATIGLTAVNGSASTFLRSDGSPALSQAIVPTWTGVHTFNPAARSSGVASYFTVTTPADTGITASTESIGVNFVAGTRTWADGTVALQREHYIGAPTYNKTTTSLTITRAATFTVSGAPIAGTGVTITNSYAIDIPGISHFGSQLGGTTQQAVGGTGLDVADSCNTTGGQTINIINTNVGASAFSGVSLGTNLSNGNTFIHYGGVFLNGGNFNDNSFGTLFNAANQLSFYGTDGDTLLGTTSASSKVLIFVGGSSTTNEVARFTTTSLVLNGITISGSTTATDGNAVSLVGGNAAAVTNALGGAINLTSGNQAAAAGSNAGNIVIATGGTAATGTAVMPVNGASISLTSQTGRARSSASVTAQGGGAITITTGTGGAESGASGTGGGGGAMTFATGAGGAANGGSGTRTGGDSGSITYKTGAAGVGTTVNGTAGSHIFQTNGANTRFTIANTTATFAVETIFAAATTSLASYNIPAGTAPTSPAEGDMWADSTQKAEYGFIDGIKQARTGGIFTQTATKTVTNTVTETSIIGTGVGTMTLPANFFVAGKTIRLRIGGIYSTPIGAPSLVIKVKYGSTVIATVTTSALLSNATNLEFDGEVLITCRTTGGTGTVMVHGDIEYATGVAGTIAVDPLNNAGATTTIDTTAASLLDVTVTWDTNTTSRSVSSTITTCEVIN